MAYGTLEEFLRRLGKESATAAEQAAAQGALDAATGEIDSYLGYDILETPPTLTPEQEALLESVNYDRAGEHWRWTPFGALNTGPELPPILTARNSWYRHARKLASLKTTWGVA